MGMHECLWNGQFARLKRQPQSGGGCFRTFKSMCRSLTLISMGSTCEAESSSRKRERLRSVDIKKLARYPWRCSCRKPLRLASGERVAAQGPFSRRARTSGL